MAFFVWLDPTLYWSCLKGRIIWVRLDPSPSSISRVAWVRPAQDQLCPCGASWDPAMGKWQPLHTGTVKDLGKNVHSHLVPISCHGCAPITLHRSRGDYVDLSLNIFIIFSSPIWVLGLVSKFWNLLVFQFFKKSEFCTVWPMSNWLHFFNSFIFSHLSPHTLAICMSSVTECCKIASLLSS